MAVLALLSYRHVKQQLYRQSENRLQQANVALGQAIFERLLLLDATLKSIPPQAILQLDVSKRKPKPAPVAEASSQAKSGKPDPDRQHGWPAGDGRDRAGTDSQAAVSSRSSHRVPS